MSEALALPLFDFLSQAAFLAVFKRLASPPHFMPSTSSRVSKAPAPPSPQFYTAHELAQLLRVTENTIYRMAKRGRLPFYSIERTMRFRRRDVEVYLLSVKGQVEEERSEEV